jgi:hypothetical protein
MGTWWGSTTGERALGIADGSELVGTSPFHLTGPTYNRVNKTP